MKKILTLAVFGGLLAATTLQAQVQIYVCGSTAFRSNAYRAIRSMFDGGAPTSQNTLGSANNSGAGQMTFQGKITPLYPGQTVTIYCDWTGSVQGIHSLTATPGDNLPFLANATQGDTSIVNHTADLAFSDVFQASSGFTTPELTDESVAVQPFVWVRSASCPITVTNITMQQLRFALQGSCPLSYLTGNSSDYSSTLYFTGRTKDSGSRVIALSDCAYTGTYNVYSNAFGVWTKFTANQIVNGVNYGPGFTSGGTEAGNLVLASSNGGGIGYLGYADARTAVGAGAQIITYNGGLPFNGWTGTTNGFISPDFSPVTTGKYSLWGPEHLFINPSGANYANAYPVFTNLATYVDLDISTTVPVTAIRLSQMGNTSRSADGGKIAP
jgi:hypothetical protein